MRASDTRPGVDPRLLDLFERHQAAPIPDSARRYEPGAGYRSHDETLAGSGVFGIALASVNGEEASVGDDDLPFALQSVSKVFTYALALQDLGRDRVLERVGVEPSGDPYNSIAFDERHARPYNPMVNAGALVTTDLVKGADPTEKIARLLENLRGYAGDSSLQVDEQTLEDELTAGDHNRATAYLMRSQNMITGDVESTLRVYLSQCSVMVTSRELARMGATLANGGVNPTTGRRCLPRERVRDVLSVMYTCGMYDFAGEWAYEIGVPAKSGVSGAILCVIPGKLGIAVFSPALDEYGNSIRGTAVCEEISAGLGLHVFATEDEDSFARSPLVASPPSPKRVSS